MAEPRIRMPAWRSASPKNLPHPAGVDLAHHPRAELGDVAERGDPVARDVRARSVPSATTHRDQLGEDEEPHQQQHQRGHHRDRHRHVEQRAAGPQAPERRALLGGRVQPRRPGAAPTARRAAGARRRRCTRNRTNPKAIIASGMPPSTKNRKPSRGRGDLAGQPHPARRARRSTGSALPTQMTTARAPRRPPTRAAAMPSRRGAHLITEISGWVASSVWVKT